MKSNERINSVSSATYKFAKKPVNYLNKNFYKLLIVNCTQF